jgi:hypothetical protein
MKFTTRPWDILVLTVHSTLWYEWLLFKANSAIFQLYHGENKLNFQWDDDEGRIVVDQNAQLDFL